MEDKPLLSVETLIKESLRERRMEEFEKIYLPRHYAERKLEELMADPKRYAQHIIQECFNNC